MRVAVLADIHGNLPALEAVLGEVDAAGVDAIVLPGDMTVGPLQQETLDLLASLGGRAVWVRGNCERTLVEVFDGTFSTTGADHEAWPGTQAFIDENVLQGPPSDAEALALFTQWARQRRGL